MDELIIYLREFGEIGSADEDLIRANASELTLSRHDIFLERGEIPSRIGYLITGVLGAMRINPREEETIAWFISDRAFATGFGDYYQQLPSVVSLQAIVKSRIVYLNKLAISKLSREIPTWGEIVKHLSQRDLVEGITKRLGISGDNSRTRYLNFVLRYPGLVDRIPQAEISDYLGITPAAISRIRKGINQTKVM